MNPGQAADTAFPLVGDHLVDAAVALFESVEVVTGAVDEANIAPSTRESAAAIIGYGGHKIRGALTLLAHSSTILRWMSSQGCDGVDVCDSLGELANMILGGLKSRLISRGLTIYLSLPTTAMVRQLRLAPSEGCSRWVTFRGPHGELKIRVDAVFEDGFELAQAPVTPPAIGGDLLLF